MRLAMQLPAKNGSANDGDPRETMSADVIDLASRNAFPAVTQRKGRSDMLGLMAGVGLVAVLGGMTLWGMNAARLDNGETQQVQPQSVPAAPPPNQSTIVAPPHSRRPPPSRSRPGPGAVAHAGQRSRL